MISSKLNRNFSKIIYMTNALLSQLGEVFVETYCYTLSNIVQDEIFNILNFDDADFEIFHVINPNIHLLRLTFNFDTNVVQEYH